MIRTFPEQREAKRAALLEAVESLSGVFLAGADEAEARGTLPQATVDAIYETGLFSFKVPQVMGGAEADPMIQLDVIEAASRIESSAGWCLMIGAGSLANLAAFCPDEAIDDLFVGGRTPKTAGVFAPSGEATPVDGGYRVSGRWAFGSGIKRSLLDCFGKSRMGMGNSGQVFCAGAVFKGYDRFGNQIRDASPHHVNPQHFVCMGIS